MRIDETNAERTILGGVDAIGGVGDWALQNGTLCAVVADPSHESDIATTGGGLVDLGLCGREDDQFILYQELLNNSLADPVPTRSVTAEVKGGVARLVVTGGRDGVTVETRYELDLEVPRRVRIRTSVSSAGGMRLYGFGAALANVRGLTPFSISGPGSGPSRGFVHPTFSDRGLGAIPEAAAPAELVIAVGAEELRPGVAYGQRRVGARLENASGDPIPLPQFFLADGLATVLASFERPFWIGDGRRLGWMQLLQTRLMSLDHDARSVLEQEIWVGERADAASVTDLLWPDSPRLIGSVDDPRAVVHVERPTRDPVTHVRVEADGSFAVRLPPGDYRLRVRAPGGREVERLVAVGQQGTDAGPIPVGAPTRVILPPLGPARLVFVGIDGTEDPDFHDDLRGYTMIGDEGPWHLDRPEPWVSLAGTAADPTELVISPGRYRVLASRGPEFSVTSTEIDARAGEALRLDLAPPAREITTPGWISSDFHVHSAASLDNPTAPERRVADYVAQGAEVLVSSEHDNLYDFAPVVRDLGLGGSLVTVVGLEVTSEVRTRVAPHSIGHANSFPLPRDPLAYRRGAVPNEGRRWRDVIADLRKVPGERVIQLNHARFDDPGIRRRAFFSHMGPAEEPFDPAKPLTEPPNAILVERHPETGLRDIDFDAIELMNGPHVASYERLREDWFSLLRQGERLSGTANSDSHFLSRPAAAPRNYVRVPSDEVGDFAPDVFVRAVLEGRLYGTTGPVIELELEGVSLGDTYRGRAGVLRGTVHAASWVPVAEIRVFVSGERVLTRAIAPGEPFELPLRFDRDAFVTTEVRGEAGDIFAAVLPGYVPLAFTNPIWVDADGDGTWTPPGL